jgi:hypothetical protein
LLFLIRCQGQRDACIAEIRRLTEEANVVATVESSGDQSNTEAIALLLRALELAAGIWGPYNAEIYKLRGQLLPLYLLEGAIT